MLRGNVSDEVVIVCVKQMAARPSDHLISIEFAAAKGKDAKTVEVLKTTRQHPFYVDGKGWVPAGGLGIGNAIVTRAGPRLVVKSIKWARRAQGYTVYNFEVEALTGKEKDGKNTHSYFVGKHAGGAWVHNDCPVVIDWNKQKKHLFNLFENRGYILGKSILNADADVLLRRAGTGTPITGTPGQAGFRERINFGCTIGQHADQSVSPAIISDTSNAILHYSNRGIHIVPARP